jgi:hypothetical protein
MKKLIPFVFVLLGCSSHRSPSSEFLPPSETEPTPPVNEEIKPNTKKPKVPHVKKPPPSFEYDACDNNVLRLATDVVRRYGEASSAALDELIQGCRGAALDLGADVSYGDTLENRHDKATEFCDQAAQRIRYYRSVGDREIIAPAATCTLTLAVKEECQAVCGASKCTPFFCKDGEMTATTCTIGGEGSLEGGCIGDLRCETLCRVNSSVEGSCTVPSIFFDYSGPDEQLVDATFQKYFPKLYALQQRVDSLFRFAYHLTLTVKELFDERGCESTLWLDANKAFEDASACLVPVAAAIITTED